MPQAGACIFGAGPLSETVEKFHLGVAVAPDSLDEIKRGMAQLLAEPVQPKWEEYKAYASWDTNAVAILRAAGLEMENVKS